MTLTQTQVSQLYVAIFNWASEGSGNAYWQAQSDMADVIFDIASGTYHQVIDGFDAGDVLDFPTGNLPTVTNSDFFDGRVEVGFVLPGAVTVIELTGLDPAADMQLIGIQHFDSVFGEGTIV